MPGKRVGREPEPIDVVPRRVEPKVDEREALDDQIFLRRTCEPERDVCFASRKIDVEVGAVQIELNLGISFSKTLEVRRNETRCEHLRGGELHDALELLILSSHVTFDA